nr:hypothetical protein [Streptomyces sp. SID8377]
MRTAHTVVHGDFHPGNRRWDGRRGVTVDFADGHYCHPVLDGLRPREFLDEPGRHEAAETWARTWSAVRLSSEPASFRPKGAAAGWPRAARPAPWRGPRGSRRRPGRPSRAPPPSP